MESINYFIEVNGGYLLALALLVGILILIFVAGVARYTRDVQRIKNGNKWKQ